MTFVHTLVILTLIHLSCILYILYLISATKIPEYNKVKTPSMIDQAYALRVVFGKAETMHCSLMNLLVQSVLKAFGWLPRKAKVDIISYILVAILLFGAA